MRGLGTGLACALIACGTSSPRDKPSRPAVVAHAVRVAGKLDAPPAGIQVWPTRVCVDGNGLVFENSCGCNDALLCHVDRADPHTIFVSLTKDPTRRPMCDDCFPMVPARCLLPAASDAPRAIAVNGAVAFALPAGAADGSCWTEGR